MKDGAGPKDRPRLLSDASLVVVAALVDVHAGDPRRPVAQRCAGSAAATAGREVCVQRAGLGNVLGGDPDVATIDDRRAVIAPPRTVGIRVVEDRVATEAISGVETPRCPPPRNPPTGDGWDWGL